MMCLIMKQRRNVEKKGEENVKGTCINIYIYLTIKHMNYKQNQHELDHLFHQSQHMSYGTS